MTAPKKDPSAMGLLNDLLGYLPDRVLPIGGVGPELELAERHSRNVDKQRRRLLAEKVEAKARAARSTVDVINCRIDQSNRYGTNRARQLEEKSDYWLARATKLRALAERLRATG
jgi:hypothetical protein